MSKIRWFLSRLFQMLWLRVSLFAFLGLLAAVLASVSGHVLSGKAPLDISSDAIKSLLTIIASSMLAVTTFSVGALTAAYRSATANATPRATSLLIQDQTTQNSLATFVGSFLFSIVGLVALTVSAYGPEGRVVLFLVTLLVILLIVIALLRWIDQLTKLGRVSDTVARIETATHEAMKTRAKRPYLGGRQLKEVGEGRPVRAIEVGYIQFIDMDALNAVCERHELEFDICVLPGTFVYEGSELGRLRGDMGAQDDDACSALLKGFEIGETRTMDHDPRFGLVVLSEVAQRALSPGINDAGTAIDVIGRQTRLLSYWVKAFETAARNSPDYPRIGVPGLRFQDMYEDAYHLIARDGATQIDVLLRLVKALDALTRTGPPDARAAAARQLELAQIRASENLPTEQERQRLAAALMLSISP